MTSFYVCHNMMCLSHVDRDSVTDSTPAAHTHPSLRPRSGQTKRRCSDLQRLTPQPCLPAYQAFLTDLSFTFPVIVTKAPPFP